MTAACYDWPTSLRARHTETTEASVMQQESEAIYVGALTNMAAGESVVTCNVLVPGAKLLLNSTAQVSDIE